jgi:hypothetical protein
MKEFISDSLTSRTSWRLLCLGTYRAQRSYRWSKPSPIQLIPGLTSPILCKASSFPRTRHGVGKIEGQEKGERSQTTPPLFWMAGPDDSTGVMLVVVVFSRERLRRS